MTAEQALATHGFDWERLEKLAAAALRKRMRDRGITLTGDRKAAALEHCVLVGAAKARDYDVALANGLSFASFLFRRMYPRLIDFLRDERGDERRGTPLEQVPTDPTTLPLGTSTFDIGSFDEEVEALASTLPDRARWTLKNIGQPIAWGFSLTEAAEFAGVSVDDAQELLEELSWRLGRDAAADTGPEARDAFSLMDVWSAAA